MYLITPYWKKNLSAGLPTKFVMKISSQITFTEAGELMKEKNLVMPEMEELTQQLTEAMTSSVRRLHNTEANIYLFIDQHNIDLPHPKIFGKMLYMEENRMKGFLIMEYIEGALNLNLYDNISVEELKKIFRGIATLEAASLRFSEEEQASLEYNPFKDLMETRNQTIAGHALGEKIEAFEKIFHEMLDLDIFTQLEPPPWNVASPRPRRSLIKQYALEEKRSLRPSPCSSFKMNQVDPDSEAKQKVEDLVIEKMGALFDYMLYYHQRNMDLKKNSHESN